MPTQPHTSLYLSAERQSALRALAGEIGLMNERGPAAGRLGSVSALMTALADAALSRPAETRLAIAKLLRK